MKKWFKRIGFAVGVLPVALVLLVLAGSVVARQIGRFRAEHDFPPPGRLVEVDGRVSHLYCTGTGSPTVILESGLDDLGSLSWSLVQEELRHTSRVCSYDRAGVMWSEPGKEPRDAGRIADELHALLTVASEAPPYVLVGHSMGGVLVRVFDQRYPGEAEGLVLVDSAHPEQETRFPSEVRQLIADSDSELMPR